MFCPTCGIALTHQMKYCNRCGAHLTTSEDAAVSKATEKRLDEYMDGLFWLTVFGLGLIVGGTVLIKKIQIGDGLMIAYLIVSSVAFLINFLLNLREIQRLKELRELNQPRELEALNTNELSPPTAQSAFAALPSVIENTTRELQSVAKERAR